MRLFDLHCDTLTSCRRQGLPLAGNGKMVDLEEGVRFSRWVQFFAVFVPDSLTGKEAVDFTWDHIRYFEQQAGRYPHLLRPVDTLEGLEQEGDGCRGILSIEGGRALGGDLDLVDQFYQAGVRMITLTWNGENELGYGVSESRGLKPFGREVVRRMEEKGMAVDVSHLSDAGMEDVLETVDGPVVASHSNFRAVCGHRRNLADSHAREVIRRGGLIGLNFYRDFLSDTPSQAGLEDLRRHLDYGLSLGGSDSLALGSDFDGASMPSELDRCGKLPQVYEYLLEKNYSQELLDKIFYGNACRFFARLLPQHPAQ